MKFPGGLGCLAVWLAFSGLGFAIVSVAPGFSFWSLFAISFHSVSDFVESVLYIALFWFPWVWVTAQIIKFTLAKMRPS